MPVSHAQRYQAFGAVGEAGFNNTEPVSGLTVVIHDAFDTTVSADIAGRTPDTTNTPGNTWTLELGTINANSGVSGAAECTAVIGLAAIGLDAVGGTFEVDVTLNAVSQSAALLSRVDVTNNYFFGIQIHESVDLMRAIRRDAGNYTYGTEVGGDAIAITVASGNSYAVKLVTDGDDHTATLDGGDTLQFSDANLNTFAVGGFWSGNVAGGLFDDFKVSQ